ncbi:hypothetical protein, partial [Actinoplanes philippinensis]|uniref:hypothetical protein n=1 Tax=Actinoplanes philippinensis TaxID=35752 RepID=UPI0033FC92EF
MTRTVEGARIFHGPQGAPQGALRRFAGTTDRQSQAALDRCKDLLIAVTHWIPPRGAAPAGVEDWKARTPEWFVRACAPEVSPARAEASRATDGQPWAFADWIRWFDHSSGLQRSWRWWDGGCSDDADFWIEVEVFEVPAAVGILTWMMRAAGARSVVEDARPGRSAGVSRSG